MELSETINLMKNHRTIRSFKDDPIPMEHVEEIIRAGQAASTSHFVQAYSVILVQDPKKREKISKVAKQSQVKDSPVFLVFCADYKRLEHASKLHNQEFSYDTAENVIVTSVDNSLVAQNVLLAAESIGYGGCFIGGIRNDLQVVSEVLELPDKVFPLFGMTLGVPNDNPELKPRLPLEAVLHVDAYKEERYYTLLKGYDERVKAYYQNRELNQKEMTWTNSMADFLSKGKRTYLKDFLAEKGFNFK